MQPQPQPSFERRRVEREKYLVLRFYARVLSGLSYTALVLGLLFGILVALFADMPPPLRVSNGILFMILGGVYFVILRATAQAIYLLFDVARNSKTTRELLEKVPAPQPKPAPGD